MIEGKSDQNHHDRFTIFASQKTGRLVTQNRQHIKPTQISAEQYLWDQPHKHTKIDPLEGILTQLQKQPVTSNNKNNICNGPHRNNTTHEHSTLYKELDNNQTKCEENNQQKLVKTRHQGAGPLITKRTRTVLLDKIWKKYMKIRRASILTHTPYNHCTGITIAFNWSTKVDHFTGSAAQNKHIFGQLSIQPAYLLTGSKIITMH